MVLHNSRLTKKKWIFNTVGSELGILVKLLRLFRITLIINNSSVMVRIDFSPIFLTICEVSDIFHHSKCPATCIRCRHRNHWAYQTGCAIEPATLLIWTWWWMRAKASLCCRQLAFRIVFGLICLPWFRHNQQKWSQAADQTKNHQQVLLWYQ